MGAALLFWGWRTGHLVAGLLLAVVLEASRKVPARLDWGERDMRRVWDITVLLYAAAAVFCYMTWEVSEALLSFLQWQPLIFFPLMAVQAYHCRLEVSLSTFLWLWRRRPGAEGPGLNGSYVYVCLCLLAASAVSDWDPFFYGGLSVLAGWALWSGRPRRLSAPILAGLYLGVVAIGYLGQQQLRFLHIQIERKTAEWIRVFQRSAFDDLTAHTSMGRVGEMKDSGRIVLQFEPDPQAPAPARLRQASYNKLYVSTWFGAQRQLRPVPPVSLDEWNLVRGAEGKWSARVFMQLPGGRGLLPLPVGTVRLQHLPANEVMQTQFGAVRVDGVPGPLSLVLRHGADRLHDQSPVPTDLIVPAIEEDAVSRAAEEMGLARGQDTDEILSRLATFFGNHFKYVPYQTGVEWRLTARDSLMKRFLLEERSGHCEWFATATVLLLRQAGIPARYATGFAVQPSARSGAGFLIRERDAHAWALAYVNGAWREVDFTPGGWAAIEADRGAWYGPLVDGVSKFWFRYTWWRASTPLGGLVPYALAGAAVAFGLDALQAQASAEAIRAGHRLADWPANRSLPRMRFAFLPCGTSAGHPRPWAFAGGNHEGLAGARLLAGSLSGRRRGIGGGTGDALPTSI